MSIQCNYSIAPFLIGALGYAGFRMAELMNTGISASATFSGTISSSRCLFPVIEPAIAGTIGTVVGMAYGVLYANHCPSKGYEALALVTTLSIAFFAHTKYLPTYSRPEKVLDSSIENFK